MLIAQASKLNLGPWNKVKAFAERRKVAILLASTSFRPSASQWEFILLEMPPNNRESFICAVVSEQHPDEIDVITIEGVEYLRCWWD